MWRNRQHGSNNVVVPTLLWFGILSSGSLQEDHARLEHEPHRREHLLAHRPRVRRLGLRALRRVRRAQEGEEEEAQHAGAGEDDEEDRLETVPAYAETPADSSEIRQRNFWGAGRVGALPTTHLKSSMELSSEELETCAQDSASEPKLIQSSV